MDTGVAITISGTAGPDSSHPVSCDGYVIGTGIDMDAVTAKIRDD